VYTSIIFCDINKLKYKIARRSELESSQMKTNDNAVLANDQLVKSVNRISKLCVRNWLSHCEDLCPDIENPAATNER
jgi:hypothetical protein